MMEPVQQNSACAAAYGACAAEYIACGAECSACAAESGTCATGSGASGAAESAVSAILICQLFQSLVKWLPEGPAAVDVALKIRRALLRWRWASETRGQEPSNVRVFPLACPFNWAAGPHLAAPRRHPKLHLEKLTPNCAKVTPSWPPKRNPQITKIR